MDNPLNEKQGRDMKLGINGLGRIGKLTLWHHVGRKYFNEIVINMGRELGTSLNDLAHYIERDSTYGTLHSYLYGHRAKSLVSNLDEKNESMSLDGIPVKILRKERNPKDIDWYEQGVRLAIDTTGQFLDPTLPADDPKGSVRGHIEAGAEKVLVSAPFKIKDKSKSMPEDAVTTVMGVNGNDYDPIILSLRPPVQQLAWPI